MSSAPPKPLVAIACGGTGGHLFPGLAVGEALQSRGVDVTLLISPKEVDQQAAKVAKAMTVVTLPAVALDRGARLEFFLRGWQSYRAVSQLFHARPPQAVLAMGGFTSAPPVLAARKFRAATFLHEANTIPGRANRWLAHFVDAAFVYFAETSARLRHPRICRTGMPVRSQFTPSRPGGTAACRLALGLLPHRPVLLVMGGSQGASAINDWAAQILPQLAAAAPELQFLHLTGPKDAEKIQAACAAHKLKAVVRPFLAEMELALGAATVAVSRAGASTLAELAALRVPAILIPYPAAADNHQFFNARAFTQTGAARMLEPRSATADQLAAEILQLLNDPARRAALSAALAQWHSPDAAVRVAERILSVVAELKPKRHPAADSTPSASPLRPVEKFPGRHELEALTP